MTALHVASFKGHNEIVRYLCLQGKLDANTPDQDGVTPLMFAAKQGELDVVRTLVESAHADINIAENVSSVFLFVST